MNIEDFISGEKLDITALAARSAVEAMVANRDASDANRDASDASSQNSIVTINILPAYVDHENYTLSDYTNLNILTKYMEIGKSHENKNVFMLNPIDGPIECEGYKIQSLFISKMARTGFAAGVIFSNDQYGEKLLEAVKSPDKTVRVVIGKIEPIISEESDNYIADKNSVRVVVTDKQS